MNFNLFFQNIHTSSPKYSNPHNTSKKIISLFFASLTMPAVKSNGTEELKKLSLTNVFQSSRMAERGNWLLKMLKSQMLDSILASVTLIRQSANLLSIVSVINSIFYDNSII